MNKEIVSMYAMALYSATAAAAAITTKATELLTRAATGMIHVA